MKKSVKKRNLVMKMLANGETKAEAMRAVKAKFGSGIASRDVGLAAKEVAKMASGTLAFRPVASSPRDGRLREEQDVIETPADEAAGERVKALQAKIRAKIESELAQLGDEIAAELGEKDKAPSVTAPTRPVPALTPTFKPKAKESQMRRFVLDRSFDPTGTSGTGIVAEGVQFSSGHVVLHWLSQLETISVYGNASVLEQLHGHDGNTVIKWID